MFISGTSFLNIGQSVLALQPVFTSLYHAAGFPVVCSYVCTHLQKSLGSTSATPL